MVDFGFDRALPGFLDLARIGDGDVLLEPIGDGHSNLTYLMRRGDIKAVLRRPPRGELAKSANDVLREASILASLEGSLPVPLILASCDDPGVIGAPFFIAEYIEGTVIGTDLPAPFVAERDAAEIAHLTVKTLAQVHAVDLAATGLDGVGRPTGYLARQLRRFGRLLEHNATRPLPDLESVGRWLADGLPASSEATLVHGDFRLGNLMFGPGPRVAAVLDWEMATIGDPLADLGYLTATWAEAEDPPNPMLDLSAVTRDPHFPNRQELADSYATLTGRSIDDLHWYQVLALWKSAIFLEGSYRRFIAGDSEDPYFGQLGDGVLALGRAASNLAHSA
jgi:aminoglycoside phosphotransferase (APT) family kinase protein